ncbi:MAG: hypothetical protein ACXWID_04925 [Pyrinomonadaceae bacterium]
MSDEQHQLDHGIPRKRKGAWLLFLAVFVFLLLGFLVLFLSPAGTRGDVLLRFLSVATSWPVVAGVILVAFFTSFRPEISSYMKFAKVRYGEFEVSADQSQTPTAALGLVANETKQLSPGDTIPAEERARGAQPTTDNSELKAWLASELEKRELETASWKNVFLDQFLVEGAKVGLVWFQNFTAVPESFYHAKLEGFIPDPQKRSRILRTLLELVLVLRTGDLLSITGDGIKYVEHLYSLAAADGRPVKHPFVSREDIQRYGRWGIHGDTGTLEEDACHHRDIKVRSQPPTAHEGT